MQKQLDEIKQLAGSRVDLKTFYDRLLFSLSEATSADVAVAWDCSRLPYHPISEHANQVSTTVKNSLNQQRHLALLDTALKQKRPVLVPSKGDGSQKFPVIALGPIQRNGSRELLELFLPPERSEQEYREWMQMLSAYCEIANSFSAEGETPPANGLDSSQLQQPPREISPDVSPGDAIRLDFEKVNQFVDHIHRELDLKTTAAQIANEARRVLNCDRVSVVQLTRGKAKVLAISGQPSVNRRSNTVRLLQTLAGRVIRSGQSFWYPDDSEQAIPPEIERPLNDYLTLSTTRSLIIEPIVTSTSREHQMPEEQAKEKSKIIGGVVFEHFSSQWTRQNAAQPIQLVRQHSKNALENAINHRSLFLYPVWNTLGKSKLVIAARNIKKSLLVVAGLLLVALMLVFVKIPFRISCDGVMLPKGRQVIFAGVDGLVTQVNGDHGSEVDKNDVLVRLYNNQLQIQREELVGSIEQVSEKLQMINTMLTQPRNIGDQNNPDNSTLQWKSLEAEKKSFERQLIIVNEQIAKLEVPSTMTGTIISWDVKQQLINRPVRRGDPLMEVADVNGEWELELKLPDRKFGHLVRARQELGMQDLEVTFLLAADPNRNWTGKIVKVANSAGIDQEHGQTISVTVEFDQDALDIRQAGSGVTAKIHCGQRSMGYVWLHPIQEFFQSEVFFRLW